MSIEYNVTKTTPLDTYYVYPNIVPFTSKNTITKTNDHFYYYFDNCITCGANKDFESYYTIKLKNKTIVISYCCNCLT